MAEDIYSFRQMSLIAVTSLASVVLVFVTSSVSVLSVFFVRGFFRFLAHLLEMCGELLVSLLAAVLSGGLLLFFKRLCLLPFQAY